ncbi:MAG: alpha-1,2-fucosyltransferase [Paraprevotella sp.]|nr:alpha-1,2-fucosyltransferase [Paraprevotella sp.]
MSGEKYIYVSLFGRLGNNLFQLAAAASLAKRMNAYMIAIPNPNYVVPSKNPQPLSVYLKPYKKNILKAFDIREGQPLDCSIYHEPEFCYNKLPETDGIYLHGYFQSEKYFDVAEVRYLLRIEEPMEQKLQNQYKYLLSKHPVSINVRRGDYLKMQSYHPVCTLDYFKTAMHILGKHRHFLIDSDDLEWCKSVFHGENIHFIEGLSDVESLYLQSLCSDHIISNSTFGWWAAWLDNSPDKKVIAPKQWFGKQITHLDTKDLLPNSWTTI